MILAIVLGIAVPGVLGIIERAKKDAFKQSASMLLETGKLYYGQRKMDRDSIKDQEIFYFPETTELEYSGEKPKDGYLTIYEDGSQYIEVTNGTYCAYGEQASDIKIKDGQCQDQTPGVLDGSGTEKDPYKIESIEDLVQFGKNVDNGNTYENQYVTLERSLDFKNEKSYVNHLRTDYGDINENGVSESLLTELTTEKGFNPIGNYDNKIYFSGKLNGQKNYICNFYSNRTDDRTALFVANRGVVHSISLTGKVSGLRYSALLVGINYGNVAVVEVKGIVTGHGSGIGGIVGQNGSSDVSSARLENSFFQGEIVNNSAGSTGGTVGLNAGNIYNVEVDAEIEGITQIGGIVGQNGTPGIPSGFVQNAISQGKISGSENVGGLIGMNAKGTLKNSYSTASIAAQNDSTGSTEGTTSNAVGGAIGFIGCTGCDHSNVKVENVYATGDVSGIRETGGLVGQNGASSENTKTKYLTLENGYSLGNVVGEQDAIGGSIGTNIMNAKNLYTGGNVFGGTDVGGIVGRRENSDATITNVYSKEGQQVSGSNQLTLGTVVSLPTLSPSSWWKNTLGFDNNWKIEDGYYPLLYKVDESGNPTTELLPGQKKIPIMIN